MEKQKHQNIPDTGFLAERTDWVEERRLVRFNTGASFRFAPFAMFQFIAGHQLTLMDSDGDQRLESTLLSKLAIFNMEIGFGAQGGIDLERREVVMLKDWLEKRMRHCEQERDSRTELSDSESARNVEAVLDSKPLSYPQDRNQKFNADTYIAMKYLMLELREWLFGEVLD
jgi:hypothetical protein